MAPPDLLPGSLYVLLFNRNDPPIVNDYHWALYLHENPTTGGTKYHIKTVGPGWIPDHGSTVAIMKQFLLVGLFRIADVPEELYPHLDRTFRSQDANLNHPTQTCRVWLLHLLSQLQRPVDGKTIIECDDLSALQQEILDWGNLHAMSAAANEQPRPIGASNLCGLSHCTMDTNTS
ncbi:uncharacterized protein N7469_001106 [Penicillium citrinum]|uniref:Uncharacterized protein n=2 Tax=Penicillium TaxID=5073 RepID=A0A9W9PE03_PENCI|nr:uncharacterized protein N7469_001106 [Penicillium citrinum]KAJ5242779.1 hypothetical protein N7469_001106 [Penicillium citrinum]KAJ5599709.1 hypothetical protein N7450_000776 [Penicillium hetheringtonii]KAK5806592.1 hypothetical protein VI817_000850 [Penicillium citrinum]